jgi:fatty acid desaturase
MMIRPDQFIVTRVEPVVPARYQMMMRLLLNGTIYTSLAYLSVYVDPWAPAYYAVLWIGAIFSSFGLFMMLRQVVQHGNADRGWLSNSRVFLVSDFIRFAVFPLGQDYHLPHHMYASIPHYNLRELHENLLKCPEYAAEATEVHGYFASPESPQVHPTVLDVLGPDWSPHVQHEIHLDHSVLADMDVLGAEEIIEEAERAIAGK